MTHKVTIRLYCVGVLGPAGPRTEDRTIPWKWVGICTCGWRCLSWHWRLRSTPTDRGAMPMALKHLCEAQGGPHAGLSGS